MFLTTTNSKLRNWSRLPYTSGTMPLLSAPGEFWFPYHTDPTVISVHVTTSCSRYFFALSLLHIAMSLVLEAHRAFTTNGFVIIEDTKEVDVLLEDLQDINEVFSLTTNLGVGRSFALISTAIKVAERADLMKAVRQLFHGAVGVYRRAIDPTDDAPKDENDLHLLLTKAAARRFLTGDPADGAPAVLLPPRGLHGAIGGEEDFVHRLQKQRTTVAGRL
ncbi:hypothetical protein V5799_011620 [Amblyomma americanum]|uniref:Uncharacterized protein n=1 Tax=Amblyomma americanum TaxID=6943 RepID=A0AAQ4EGD0_AMBAM